MYGAAHKVQARAQHIADAKNQHQRAEGGPPASGGVGFTSRAARRVRAVALAVAASRVISRSRSAQIEQEGSNSESESSDAGDMSVSGSVAPRRALRTLMLHDFFRHQSVGHERPPRLTVDPMSARKVAWDLYVALFIVYSVIVVPWRIAFDKPAEDGWLVLDVFADCMFLIDIAISFRTGFHNELGAVTWKGMESHYLRRWFIIDFLSVVPVDLVVRLVSGDTDGGTSTDLRSTRLLRMFRLFRLFKLLRVLRLSQLFELLANAPVNHNAMALLSLLIQILFLSHIIGCVWHWSTTMHDATDVTWVVENDLVNASTVHRYLASVSFALETMSTVGYGGFKATNNLERLLAIVTMLIGATVFGYNIVNVSELVENLDPRAAKHRERMTEVRRYVRERKLPPELAQRVRDTFTFAYSKRTLHEEEELLRALTPPLATAVVCGSRAPMLEAIPMLARSHVAFLAALARQLQPCLFPQHVALFREGDLATELYFIVRGRVERRIAVWAANAKVTALIDVAEAGHAIGASCLLGFTSAMDGEESSPAEAAFAEDPALSLTRPYSALTLLPTEVLVLSRAAATDLALQWRQEVELLARAAAEEAEDVLRAKHENARRGVFRIVRRWAFLAQSAGFDKWFEFALTNARVEERRFVGRRGRLCTLALSTFGQPISSSHPLKLRWDLFVAVCIVFSAVVVPYRLAFSVEADGPWLALDWTVDAIFYLDIILAFRTTFVEGDTAIEVTDARRIAIAYLRSWFLIDLVSTLPLYVLFNASASTLRSLRLVRALRLIRLVKLARLARLRSAAKEHDGPERINPAMVRLVARYLLLLFVAHLVACAWFGIVNASDETETWIEAYCPGSQPGFNGTLIPYCVPDFPTSSQLLASSYWALVTMTTGGFGDILPVSEVGLLVGIMTMLLGAVIFAFVVGGVLSLVLQVDPVARVHKEERALLHGYITEQQFPRVLSDSIQRAFDYVQKQRSVFSEHHLWQRMPDVLRGEVASFVMRGLAGAVPFFAEAEREFPGFLAVVGPLLTHVRLDGGDRVFVAGRGASEVFFVVHGTLEVSKGVDREVLVRQLEAARDADVRKGGGVRRSRSPRRAPSGGDLAREARVDGRSDGGGSTVGASAASVSVAQSGSGAAGTGAGDWSAKPSAAADADAAAAPRTPRAHEANASDTEPDSPSLDTAVPAPAAYTPHGCSEHVDGSGRRLFVQGDVLGAPLLLFSPEVPTKLVCTVQVRTWSEARGADGRAGPRSPATGAARHHSAPVTWVREGVREVAATPEAKVSGCELKEKPGEVGGERSAGYAGPPPGSSGEAGGRAGKPGSVLGRAFGVKAKVHATRCPRGSFDAEVGVELTRVGGGREGGEGGERDEAEERKGGAPWSPRRGRQDSSPAASGGAALLARDPKRRRALARALRGDGGGTCHLVALSRSSFQSLQVTHPLLCRWMVAALGGRECLASWVAVCPEDEEGAVEWPSIGEWQQLRNQVVQSALRLGFTSFMQQTREEGDEEEEGERKTDEDAGGDLNLRQSLARSRGQRKGGAVARRRKRAVRKGSRFR